MFPQFGATADSLSKASSLVLRIGTDAHLYDDPDDANIAALLDSKFDTEKVEALKRLLALIAQGSDVAIFFPQVVKNVASQSLEVKKLVYLYLLHYAEKRPNEALLSINCFQKDLLDTNPLVRAWALRAMAGIRLHVVAPLVLVAIGKCARDPSAYVRKCAAYALPKLYDLHQEENISSLVELVDILLRDHSPGVVGAAATAFRSVCPNNLSLIARNFRRLCETLPDVEEWGQIVLIEILLRFVVARHGLVRESIMFTSNFTSGFQPQRDNIAVGNMSDCHHGSLGGEACDFSLNSIMYNYYIEGQDEYLSRSFLNGDDDKVCYPALSSSQLNDEVRLLLQCTSPLLWSRNSAVVLAAAGVHWIMAPREEVEKIVKPLLFILRSSQASKYVVLCNILVFAKLVPSLFAPYFEDFFICSLDQYQTRVLKLEILSTIATESSILRIFDEFQDYIKDPDRRFVADTVAAIGLCAQGLPTVATTCLEGLLALMLHESSVSNSSQIVEEAGVLIQAIMSIKAIIKQNPASHEKVIVRLAYNLDVIKEPVARALIVWIVGEYCTIGQIIPKIVPTVLKYLAWSFTSEEVEAKLQILNTAAKVVLCAQGEDLLTCRKIMSYIIELAKYDLNYDVRDRSHIIVKLVSFNVVSECQEENTSYLIQNGGTHHEFVENIFSRKIPPTSFSAKNFRFYLPGSLSQVVLHAAPGYGPLPKPCSLLDTDLDLAEGTIEPAQKVGEDISSEMNGPDLSSGSSMEESGSIYDSENSIVSSGDSEGTGSPNGPNGDGHNYSIMTPGFEDRTRMPLVHLSDTSNEISEASQTAKENKSTFISTDLPELMSKSALESWLDEQPGSSSVAKSEVSTARISINDVNCDIKPKLHTLLDPTNGNGLRVDYSFSCETSTISPLLVCVDMFFKNVSTEPLTKIAVKDGETVGSMESADLVSEEPESLLSANDVPTIFPVGEIGSLDPGQIMKKVLQVRFRHHLLPLKLTVFCNGKKHLTKLWPDIGYFVRPLSMNMKTFTDEEHKLPGMFEYAKRCTFKDHIEELDRKEDQNSFHADKILVVSRCIASKVLSHANVYLVSMDMPVSFSVDDASGLCLRFSCEILSSSKPCLITIMLQGKLSEPLDVTVKVNCEETVFGLNLLNRVAAFLQ